MVEDVEKYDFSLASRCMCVYVLDFIIFKRLQFINGLRYRVKIWYNSKAVTPLEIVKIFIQIYAESEILWDLEFFE